MSEKPLNPELFEWVAKWNQKTGATDSICYETDVTLRDLFAACIAIGIAILRDENGDLYASDLVAGQAYKIANAMLEEREKP